MPTFSHSVTLIRADSRSYHLRFSVMTGWLPFWCHIPGTLSFERKRRAPALLTLMLNFYASCGHDAKIEKFCIFSPYATLNGFAELEEGVFLATHSTVVAGRKIGPDSKVSANSVVTADVPAKTLVYGVPGKMATIFV